MSSYLPDMGHYRELAVLLTVVFVRVSTLGFLVFFFWE